MHSTHTIAGMEVSKATYDEIKSKLVAAGYHHAILQDEAMLDMTGIGLVVEPPKDSPHG